ncbi:hypothetical protein NCS57_01339400 [Fusarium keratoplasticum]|uniref:Uncharacterized protein n=1 Tax=Fusarium keratoplasticum TaxID=1328300 RepID=A0ACC0QIF1_9HYPO|nr:hypothetical protein NCS57_01339400 [Fusarium keratoplasticum]KAI8652744.1 hypothetical protein NCS57_01339400 [Fusarium keratoplasticum]KAI8653457.1 hypothetical protein NCS55_01332000 [Fusarium keratoplasticum]
MSTPAAEPTPQIPSLDLFSLKGKNAFVTGGSRGIGAAIAIALADAGASVCIAQRDTTNTDTADAIRDRGVRAEIISCDLDDMDAVKGVFQRALDIMDGRIDILVNCGGILKRKEALSVSEEEWDAVMDINLKALFFLCQAAGRHMVPRRSGKIVNIASINSFIGGENYAPYSSSKGGVSQLTKALSNEWAKHNVQVNALAPGYVATDMNTALRPNAEVTAAAITGCPAGRWGTPADYAGPAVFLCSDASQYVTGEVLVVDGGLLGK